MITCHQMTEQEKETVCGWKYPGEYAAYNMPTYEEQKKKGIALMNPARAKNYYSYFDGDMLIGFTNILEEENEVFIGIGVDPELCGKGYGQKILNVVSEITAQLYPNKKEYLEVRTWNTRAVRCYEKAGFKIDGEAFEQQTAMGKGTFYRMIRDK